MTAFAWFAAALFAAYLALLAALHVTDRSRNVWRDPVSDYAVGASRPLGLAMGAAGTGGVLALAAAFALAGLPTWLWLCTAAAGVARIGANVFPTDLEGAPRTTAGRLHMLCAVAWFTLLYVAIDNATPLLTARWAGTGAEVLGALRWASAVGLAALVACLVIKPLRAWFGLAERVFLIAAPLWCLWAAAGLALRG